MEDVGAQVAPPIFIHQKLPGRFCEASSLEKKRNLPWQNPNFQQHQQRFNPGFQNSWNPNGWNWNSVMFVAKPSDSDVLQLGTGAVASSEQKEEGKEAMKAMGTRSGADEGSDSLTLNLGGSLYSHDEPASRPTKRVRPGSPCGGNYPMCQVDDCKADLSNAKEYHRRHKVCEPHSKTTKALVGKQMQRFCQQCSRFHPLSEFDEGKRSCRRRLAGHNRRRRKTQPDDISSRLLLAGNREDMSRGNVDIVNLLSIFARLQGNNVEKINSGPSIPDRDSLIHILRNSLPVAANSTERLPNTRSFDLNISQQTSTEHQNQINGNSCSSSTMDLLTVLSAALATSSPDALTVVSQRSSRSNDDDKSRSHCLEQNGAHCLQGKPVPGFPPVRGEMSSTSASRSPMDFEVQEARCNLPMQLFSSSPDDDTPPKLESSTKYFSSDSSHPVEDRSPSSSPPVVQKLFPLQTSTEIMKHEMMSTSGEDNATVEASTTLGWSSPLDLFKQLNCTKENNSIQNVPYRACYTSTSGSDHSPSSSNSDSQDRTGRIMFKLFDKGPSDLPGTLRTQIINWLSHSPSEIESYIRPGCVVLSLYISMPSTAWDQLQEDFLPRMNLLIQGPDYDFWRKGRFVVHTGRQLALYRDGKICFSKSLSTWSAPELISVSPLAIVSGRKTSLLLRGRNIAVPGTRVHCTYMGGYLSKEVSGQAYHGTIHDNIIMESFSFPGGVQSVLGRCYIEVENGFKGNSFPVIIADADICQELRLLESEFEKDSRVDDVNSEDKIQDLEQPRSRKDVLHFLNELGWLFQRKCILSGHENPDFSLTRFRFLFMFCVERDWCALVKTLLDILIERNSGKDGLSRESLEMLNEIHLLNRAVKRKCRNMVDLLISYSLTDEKEACKNYLFPPNLAGPGGITPLHLAACARDSEDIVDALTNDQQEIGLKCWNSLVDENGQSPHEYALMRNNYSYNRLVLRKLADWKNAQVSIPVGDEILMNTAWMGTEKVDRQIPQPTQGHWSCERCSVVASKFHRRMPGAQGLLHRPYIHSMLAIAAVCVCVCLFLRGSPDIGRVAPFKWENLESGFY